MIESTIVVLAKRPRPGFVKTRLTPPLSPHAAAAVAAAALTDTLDAVDQTSAATKILSFDDDTHDWLRAGWQAHRQPHGGLDRRIVAAVESAPRGPVLLVGMDTPQVSQTELSTFDPGRYDACLGLASDGGFWAIGFADPAQCAVTVLGVPMSTAHTGRTQLDRLQDSGLRVQLLPTLTDVDTIVSAREVGAAAPSLGFSQALRRLAPQWAA